MCQPWVDGQCLPQPLSILFLEAALQLGAHGVVSTGWPASPQDPSVCLQAIDLGLLDSAVTPGFDVGAEDCI